MSIFTLFPPKLIIKAIQINTKHGNQKKKIPKHKQQTKYCVSETQVPNVHVVNKQTTAHREPSDLGSQVSGTLFSWSLLARAGPPATPLFYAHRCHHQNKKVVSAVSVQRNWLRRGKSARREEAESLPA